MGNDCAGQSNARLFNCRRSILENLLSFGSVGGFAPTGSIDIIYKRKNSDFNLQILYVTRTSILPAIFMNVYT